MSSTGRGQPPAAPGAVWFYDRGASRLLRVLRFRAQRLGADRQRWLRLRRGSTGAAIAGPVIRCRVVVGLSAAGPLRRAGSAHRGGARHGTASQRWDTASALAWTAHRLPGTLAVCIRPTDPIHGRSPLITPSSLPFGRRSAALSLLAALVLTGCSAGSSRLMQQHGELGDCSRSAAFAFPLRLRMRNARSSRCAMRAAPQRPERRWCSTSWRSRAPRS